jgi:hypothetical protein
VKQRPCHRDLVDATVRNASQPEAFGGDDGFDAFQWGTEEILKETRPRSGGTLPR